MTPSSPQRRKLLFLIDSLVGGGAERVLTILLQQLPREKYHITVASLYSGGHYEAAIRERADHYISILPDLSGLRGIRKFIKRRKKSLLTKWLPLRWVWRWYMPMDADVEIAFLEGFATRFLAASPNRKALKYSWVHIDLEKLHWITPWYRGYTDEKLCFTACHKVVCVSDEVEKAMKRLYSLANTCTLLNPVDYQTIRNKAALPAAYFPRKEGVWRLVSVGRYTPQKGYLMLLQAFQIVLERGIRAELLLVGEGHERPVYEAFLKDNGMEDSVLLTGFMENPYPCLRSADLFICSSLTEGFSTAITEALVLGVPVVSTEVPGIHRQLRNEHFGVLSRSNAKDLADTIEQLLRNPERLQNLASRARSYVEDMNMDGYIRNIEALLQAPLPTHPR